MYALQIYYTLGIGDAPWKIRLTSHAMIKSYWIDTAVLVSDMYQVSCCEVVFRIRPTQWTFAMRCGCGSKSVLSITEWLQLTPTGYQECKSCAGPIAKLLSCVCRLLHPPFLKKSTKHSRQHVTEIQLIRQIVFNLSWCASQASPNYTMPKNEAALALKDIPFTQCPRNEPNEPFKFQIDLFWRCFHWIPWVVAVASEDVTESTMDLTDSIQYYWYPSPVVLLCSTIWNLSFF